MSYNKLILLCKRLTKIGPNYKPEMNGWVSKYEKRRKLLLKRIEKSTTEELETDLAFKDAVINLNNGTIKILNDTIDQLRKEKKDIEEDIFWAFSGEPCVPNKNPHVEKAMNMHIDAMFRINDLMNAFENDKSKLWTIRNRILREIEARNWILEGRGPYEWDDDEYRKEFRYFMDKLKNILLADIAEDKIRFDKAMENQ